RSLHSKDSPCCHSQWKQACGHLRKTQPKTSRLSGPERCEFAALTSHPKIELLLRNLRLQARVHTDGKLSPVGTYQRSPATCATDEGKLPPKSQHRSQYSPMLSHRG